MPLLMCPNDNSPMQEINRNGVMLDVCPQCRGIWMDRGELEKLLELSRPPAHESAGYRQEQRDPHYQDRPAEPRRYEGDARRYEADARRYDDDDRRKRKRRFDLFDFFD